VGPISTYRLDSDEWGSQSRPPFPRRHGASKRLAPLRPSLAELYIFHKETCKADWTITDRQLRSLSSPYIARTTWPAKKVLQANQYIPAPITVEATHREGIICAVSRYRIRENSPVQCFAVSRCLHGDGFKRTDSLAIAGSRIHTGLAGVDVNESASSNCISTTTMFEEELKQRIHIYRLDVCFEPAQASTDRHSISAGPDARL
jgi:hypothetical protein